MSEADTTVKAGDQAAVTDPKADGQVDYKALLAAKDAELVKAREERENYKKGMLKAKGKILEDGANDEPTVDNLVEQGVQAQLLATKEETLEREKAEIYERALRENAELRTAIANRGQITTDSVGVSSEPTMVPKGQFFSDAQIATLKAKGWDDAKIEKAKQNMLKGSGGMQF